MLAFAREAEQQTKCPWATSSHTRRCAPEPPCGQDDICNIYMLRAQGKHKYVRDGSNCQAHYSVAGLDR